MADTEDDFANDGDEGPEEEEQFSSAGPGDGFPSPEETLPGGLPKKRGRPAKVKPRQTNSAPRPVGNSETLAEAQLPKGAPINPDGTPAVHANISEEDALRFGTIDPVSAHQNKVTEERLRMMADNQNVKNVPWEVGQGNQYEAAMSIFQGDPRLVVEVHKVAPNEDNYGSLPAAQLPTWGDLMRHIEENWWDGNPAQFVWRIRSGWSNKTQGTIKKAADPFQQRKYQARVAAASAPVQQNGNGMQGGMQGTMQPLYPQPQQNGYGPQNPYGAYPPPPPGYQYPYPYPTPAAKEKEPVQASPPYQPPPAPPPQPFIFQMPPVPVPIPPPAPPPAVTERAQKDPVFDYIIRQGQEQQSALQRQIEAQDRQRAEDQKIMMAMLQEVQQLRLNPVGVGHIPQPIQPPPPPPPPPVTVHDKIEELSQMLDLAKKLIPPAPPPVTPVPVPVQPPAPPPPAPPDQFAQLNQTMQLFSMVTQAKKRFMEMDGGDDEPEPNPTPAPIVPVKPPDPATPFGLSFPPDVEKNITNALIYNPTLAKGLMDVVGGFLGQAVKAKTDSVEADRRANDERERTTRIVREQLELKEREQRLALQAKMNGAPPLPPAPAPLMVQQAPQFQAQSAVLPATVEIPRQTAPQPIPSVGSAQNPPPEDEEVVSPFAGWSPPVYAPVRKPTAEPVAGPVASQPVAAAPAAPVAPPPSSSDDDGGGIVWPS